MTAIPLWRWRRIAVAAVVLLWPTVSFAQTDTLVVGAYPANPPWENKRDDGTFEGFEVDVVNEIGNRIGADIEIQDYDFQPLFSATSSGRIDMAISSITVTNERLQNQSFTQPYYDADLGLAARSDSGITTLEGLAGQPVGALSGSTGETWIQENTEQYGFGEYSGYDTQQALLLDLQNGRVAGAVSDITGLQFSFQQMEGMEVVQRIRSGEQYAIMMQKGSPNLERVNDAITAMKEDGTMAALHEKWLGGAPDPETSTVTVLEIPQAQ